AFAGMHRFSALRPHLVVLDVILPRGDGLELCRWIRQRPGGGQTVVLVLTARDAVADRVKGLDAGADDYLVKPFALDELLARVRALLRRRTPATGGELRLADLTLDPATRVVRRGGRALSLTPKEFDLLVLF